MTTGEKSKSNDKQKRQAAHAHSEKGYEEHGAAEKEAEEGAWATVNKLGGGKKVGARRRSPTAAQTRTTASRGRRKNATATQSKAKRGTAARKPTATRKRNASKSVAQARTPARNTTGTGKKRTSQKRAPRTTHAAR
jgi:hypothetical protein